MNASKCFFILFFTFGIILSFEAGFQNCVNFEKCKEIKKNKTNDENVCRLENREYEDLTDERNCFPLLTQDTSLYSVSSKKELSPLNSACLNCGACIAVAEKLSKELLNHFQKMKDKPRKIIRVYPDVKRICSCAFEKYVLQEKDGSQFIGSSQPNSKKVSVDETNYWPKILEEMCIIFANVFGEMNIYDEWVDHPSNDLTDLLCRGNGVFASCQHIVEENPEPPSEPIPDEYPVCSSY